MGHSGEKTRKILWKNNVGEFYLWLALSQPSYATQALDALSAWLSEEKEKEELEQLIGKKANINKIISVFTCANHSILDPILKLVSLSDHIAKQLAQIPFLSLVLERLSNPNARIKLSLLKILKHVFNSVIFNLFSFFLSFLFLKKHLFFFNFLDGTFSRIYFKSNKSSHSKIIRERLSRSCQRNGYKNSSRKHKGCK